MKIFASVLLVLLFMAVHGSAADVPASVMAYKNSGRLASPTNLFYTNLVAGTNIIFEPIGSGRLKIHGTGGGGGGIISSVDPDFFEVLAGQLNLTNQNLVDWSQLGTNAFPTFSDINSLSNLFQTDITDLQSTTNGLDGRVTTLEGNTNSWNSRQGGSAVLSNLVTTVDQNVTNAQALYFSISAGLLSLTNGNLIDWAKMSTNTFATETELNTASNLLRTDVSNLQSATNGLNTRVGSLETATNGLNTRVGSLESVTNAFLTTNKSGFATANGVLTSLLNDSNPPVIKTISGSASQVTVTDNATNIALSIPSAFVAPGSVKATTTFLPTVIPLSYSGTNVTVDFSLGNKFSLTLTGACYFVQPINLTAMQEVVIDLRQDSTGTRTVSFNTAYWRFPSAAVLTHTTNALAWDEITCIVGQYATNVAVVQTLNFQ